MAELRGRRVLVTGSADGLGAAVARALALRGARVGLVGPEPADDGIELALDADLGDIASLGAAADRIDTALGGLDAVVAAAGIPGDGTVAGTEPADFARVVDTNVLGVYRTIRVTLPALTASRGYLLAVSSLAALRPMPGRGAFGASKAAVESLADSLRFEAHGRGVGVGVAYPSPSAGRAEVAAALADAVAARSARVYVPADAAYQRWIRPVRTTRLLSLLHRP